MDAEKLGLNEKELAELKAVKTYMKVDDDCPDEENARVWALYLAAKIYLGVDEPEEPHRLYDLAVWRLTLHYYDHRDSVGNEADFPAGLRPIINRLKADDAVNIL